MAHDDSQPLFLVVAHNAPHSANEAAVLQAPPEAVRAMRHIESPQRRIYAGDYVSRTELKDLHKNT